MPVTVGTTLQDGKYRIDAVLGEGGFGITYRATHMLLQQSVVVKTLKANQIDSPEFAGLQQRFMTEARILAQFQHPHIVRVSDCFVEAGLPFIVMDYIPGRTLGDLSRQHRLPEDEALMYIRQVGSALQEIHKQGLVHRDVKPDNIILKESTRQVILIDFGIARHFTMGVTETNTGMVSAGYAPIEQYLPRHQWTPATDVYALAATLYALLAGQPPVAAVLRDRLSLTDLYEFQPNLRAITKQAVLRGMEMEVAHRPESINAWLRLLPIPIEAGAVTGRTGGGRTSATVNVFARGSGTPAVAETRPQTRSRSVKPGPSAQPVLREEDWREDTGAFASTRRRSIIFPLLFTALAAGLVGAATGLLVRSYPVPSWGPKLLEQRELFPEKIPPVQRPLPPEEVVPNPEPAPFPENSGTPYEVPESVIEPEAPPLADPYSPAAEPSVPPNSSQTSPSQSAPPSTRPPSPAEPASPEPPTAAPVPVEPAPAPEPIPVEPEPTPVPEAPAAPTAPSAGP